MDPDEVTEPDAVIVVDTDSEVDDTPTVEVGDTTVIVEETPETPGVELDPFTERFTKLEARVDALENKSYSTPDFADVEAIADSAAEMALDTALAVDEEIVAATDEAIVESIEDAEIEDVDDDGEDELTVDEIAPVSARVHPLFRSRADWMNRN